MRPHQIEWTPERIQAFWDHYSSKSDAYFSGLHGRSLIAYVKARIRIGVPLDYGCGRGHLLAYLAKAGATEVYGIEQSPESRALAARRIGPEVRAHLGHDVAEATVDTAFMVEVVEHMDDDALQLALGTVRNALRPGGHLVITTPNEEDLSHSSVFCPECGAIFHSMQHVRSWTAGSLSECLEKHGFETISAEATILSPYGGLRDRLFRAVKLSQGSKPHLIYIGRKI